MCLHLARVFTTIVRLLAARVVGAHLLVARNGGSAHGIGRTVGDMSPPCSTSRPAEKLAQLPENDRVRYTFSPMQCEGVQGWY